MAETKEEKDDLLRELLSGEEGTAFDRMNQFMELMMRYNSAIREVRTKFEVLNEELSYKTSRNHIAGEKAVFHRAETQTNGKTADRRIHIGIAQRRRGHTCRVFVHRRHLQGRGDARKAGRYHRRRGQGLYTQAQAERIQELSHDRRDPRVFLGGKADHARGNTAAHRGDGFLGEPRTSDQI